jgi:ATP-binding cassette subfamily B protein
MSAVSDFVQDRETIAENRRAMFRTLRGYVVRNWHSYALGLVATVIYVGFFALFPKTVQWAIEDLVAGVRGSELWWGCVLVAAVTLLRAMSRFFSRITIFNAAREIEFQLRNDLFEHLQRLPQSFYFTWRTGDLMSRAVNDLTAVRLMLGVGLLQVAQTPFMIVSAVGMMLWIDPELTVWVLAPLPVFILIARLFGRAMHSTNLAVQVGLADMSNHLQESVSGIAVVKAYAMEATTDRKFGDLTQNLYDRWMHAVRVQAGMPAITGLLPNIGMLMLFVIGGGKMMAGELTVGEFFAFFLFNIELTMPLFFIGWMFNLIQRGTASMQRIDEVLQTEPSIADRADMLDVRELHGEVEFKGLSFEYPGPDAREPALKDVDLHIPAGAVVGIVGPVGSGKTTLASLIPRLYEMEDGVLFLDGNDVNRIPLGTLRTSIAVVPQDSFLFSMTLADNVAYGLPETDPAHVLAAADRAQLAKDVVELPEGYETLVGERGVMLSGGQRQRTALARALALDPKILILDDTLSAVDAETEAAIQEGLTEVFAGRTVIVVASRVSTVRDADLIVVIEEGRIVERGRHDDLVASGGLYARLAQDQAAEQTRESGIAAMGAVGGGE